MKNYQLYRTNVLLGGQMKYDLLLESNSKGDKTIIDSFHISPISDRVPYAKSIDDNLLNYPHNENIRSFYKRTADSFYKDFTDPILESHTPLPADYEGDRCNTDFEMGCRRVSYQVYKKQFEFLVPVWIEQLDDISKLSFEIEVRTKPIKDQIDPWFVRRFGFDSNQKLTQYFNDYISHIGINKGCDWVFNISKSHTSLTGMNVASGLNAELEIVSLYDNLTKRERPLLEFNNLIINNLKDYTLITKQLFNFCLCFNVEDILNPYLLNEISTYPLYLNVIVKIGDKKLDLMDIFSNHEFIQAKYIGELDTLKYDGSSIIKKSQDVPTFNVLDYLQDYKQINVVDKNKICQSTIHWIMPEKDGAHFNFYDGFNAIYDNNPKSKDSTYSRIKKYNEETANIKGKTSYKGNWNDAAENLTMQNSPFWCNSYVLKYEPDANSSKITTTQAALVTDFGDVFKNSAIGQVLDLKYFTGVTSIKSGTFENCKKLKSIVIPQHITTIESDAFLGCEELSYVELESDIPPTIYPTSWPKSLKISVPKYALNTYKNHPVWKNAGTFEGRYKDDNGNILFKDPNAEALCITCFGSPGATKVKESEILVPTVFDSSTFAEASTDQKSKVVDFGELEYFKNLTRLNTKTFAGFNSLQTIAIPYGVSNIGADVFAGCSSLTSIAIPSSVTSIGNNAFNGCSSLTSITIPSSVTSIGDNVFSGCSSLTSITIPSSSNNSRVMSIGNNAFAGCTNLSSISADLIGVTSIGNSAFSNCTNLTSMNLGTGLNYIGPNAFNGSGLKEFELKLEYLGNEKLYIGAQAFQNCKQLSSVSIKNLNGSKDGNDLPCQSTTLSASMFDNCDNLKEVDIMDLQIGSIGNYVFQNCKSLKHINLPIGVEYIGESSFTGCEKLKTIIWNNYITNILPNSFSDCSELEFFCLNTSIKNHTQNYQPQNQSSSIEAYAFNNCKKLKSIYIGTGMSNRFLSIGSPIDGVEAPSIINSTAFKNCQNLKDVIFDLDAFDADSHYPKIESLKKLKFNFDVDLTSQLNSKYTNIYIGGSNHPDLSISQFIDYLKSNNPAIANSFEPISRNIFTYRDQHINDMPNPFPSNAAAVYKIDDLDNRINDSSNASQISKIEYFEEFGNFYNIFDIKANMFTKFQNLKNITIPPTTKTIGESAFKGLKKLKNIIIPEGSSLKTIEKNSFKGCSAIENISLPDSLITIGESAFADCLKLESIIIPKTVSEIKVNAFAGCSSLKYIACKSSTPPAVENGNDIYEIYNTNLDLILYVNEKYLENYIIDEYWSKFTNILTFFEFQDVVANDLCLNLLNKSTFLLRTDLNITDIPAGHFANSKIVNFDDFNNFEKLTSIPDGLFSGCTNLTSITIPSGVTSIGDNAFSGCTNLTSITIPSDVTSIGDNAFSGCTNLTSITIPSGVDSIGDNAFSGCTNLTSITIPSGVTSIGDNAFSGCTNLTSITIPSSVISIGDNAFNGCSSLIFINIPPYVTSIGTGMFGGCSKLTSITIPPRVTSIGDSAFGGCSKLTSITIPYNVTSIGNLAFAGCALRSIMFEEGSRLKTIGDQAFYGCNRLTSINIPEGVTSIGNNAFESCNNLTSITIPSSVKYIGTGWPVRLSYIDDNYVYTSKEKKYIIGCKNKSITTSTISSSVINIGVSAFSGCTNLQSIEFEEGSQLNTIGNNAFGGCNKLTSITIPSGVTSIGVNAFYGCTNLASITIPSGVTSIENSAFENCGNLTSITIPSGVTNIRMRAFASCTNLQSVVFEEGSQLTSIGNRAFSNCAKLTSINFEDCHNLISIENYTFSGCAKLTSITIPASMESIGEYAFSNNPQLTKFEFEKGSNLITLGLAMLAKNSNLKTCNLNNCEKLITIGSSAFSGCSNLEYNEYIPDSVEFIGEWCFDECNKFEIKFTENSNLRYLGGASLSSNGSGVGDNGKNEVTFLPGSINEIDEEVGLFNECPYKHTIVLGSGWNLDYIPRAFINNSSSGKFKNLIMGSSDPSTWPTDKQDFGINIPKGTKKIGDFAFSGSAATKVYFNDELEEIGNGAFQNCIRLGNGATYPIDIPDGVKRIGNFAFRISQDGHINSAMSYINIPKSVTEIGRYAFTGTKWLDNEKYVAKQGHTNAVYINDILYTSLGSEVIIGNNTTYPEIDYIIKPSTTTICAAAFEDNKNIRKIDLPVDVKIIGNRAFYGCVNLDNSTGNIDLSSTKIETIEYAAFAECSKIKSVTIPSTIKTMETDIFHNCTSLKWIEFKSETPPTIIPWEQVAYDPNYVDNKNSTQTSYNKDIFGNKKGEVICIIPRTTYDNWKAYMDLFGENCKLVICNDGLLDEENIVSISSSN